MDSLRKKAVSGVKWLTLGMGGVSLIDLARVAVLAHILAPSDFGLVGMVLVVTGVMQNFFDLGVSDAIIQRKDQTSRELSSLYWMNFLIGFAIFIIIVALTPLIVRFYNQPALAPLVRMAALTFLVAPLGHQFKILMQKNLKFDVIAKIEFFSTLAAFPVFVISATMGLGAWSLILGGLAGNIIAAMSFFLYGISFWKPGFHFDRNDLKGYLSFGFYQVGQRVASYFSYNVDNLLIGRFLGPEMLGVYMVAYQLIIKPFSKISPVLMRVAFPIFARRQDDNRALGKGYLELVKILSYITFPMLAGIAATAPVLIPVIYGAKWDLAIPLVQIMSVIGLFWTIQSPSAYTVLAKGRADICFKMDLALAVINTFAFWFAVQGGIFTLVWTWVGIIFLYYVAWQAVIQKMVGLSLKKYLSVVSCPLLMSIAMGVAVHFVKFIAAGSGLGNAAALALLVITGVVVYLPLVLSREYGYFKELWKAAVEAPGKSHPFP